VDDGLALLGSADSSPGTPYCRLSLLTSGGRTADGTGRRHLEGLLAPVALFLQDPDDLRYDVTGLVNYNGVTLPHVLLSQYVLVVEGCPANGGPRHPDGFQNRHRGQGAGAANLDVNPQYLCYGLLCLELVGDSPAWALCRGPQELLLLQGVDLDDNPIYIVVQLVASLFPLRAERGHPRKIQVSRCLRVQLETPSCKGVQGFTVGLGLPKAFLGTRACCSPCLHKRDLVDKTVQGAPGGYLGVKLAQGPRRRVAGVCKGLLSVLLSPVVQLSKGRLWHVGLAPDL